MQAAIVVKRSKCVFSVACDGFFFTPRFYVAQQSNGNGEMKFSTMFLVMAGLSMAACASQPGPPELDASARGPAAAAGQPRMLLAAARKTQNDKGCAEAIPLYRVAAAMGEGYEIAQYELAACLLRAETEGVEKTLTNLEARFWLERAAWAGDVRAQGELATRLSGLGDGFDQAEPIAALGWALIYAENGERAVFGLSNTPASVLAHLDATLSETEKTEAELFAKNFKETKMAAFSLPEDMRQQTRQRFRQQRPAGRPPGGRRRAETAG